CVALTKPVCRSALFQRTTELLMKLLPLTLSVKVGPPANTRRGIKLVSTCGVPVGGLMVKPSALEAPPPPLLLAGLKTVICAVPGLAMSLAGISAIKRVLSPKLVVRFAPFQRTVELLRKFVPVIVNVKAAPPAVA